MLLTILKTPSIDVMINLMSFEDGSLMSTMNFSCSVKYGPRINLFFPFVEKTVSLFEGQFPNVAPRRRIQSRCVCCIQCNIVEESVSRSEIVIIYVTLNSGFVAEHTAELFQKTVNILDVASCAPKFKGEATSLPS